MRFLETPLRGAFEIDLEPVSDERGFFARAWCRQEFEAHGLESGLVQCNVSFNARMGTVRGLHYQTSPHEEVKIVRCTAGVIFDVIVDLRPTSPTYTAHHPVLLSGSNRKMLYVPRGFAHGFQTLEDNTEVFYQMSEFHAPESSRGVRWNDPAFSIAWPDTEHRIMSARDRAYPDFQSRVLQRP